MNGFAPYSAALLSIGMPVVAAAQTPIFTVDSQNATQTALDSQAQPALVNNSGTAGIVVLLCWKDVSSAAGTLDFKQSNGTPNTTLSDLQTNLAYSTSNTGGPVPTDQGLVIGIKAGACAPKWLTTLPQPVPMPNFYAQPWENAVDGQTLNCAQYPLPASWDANFEAQYSTAVSLLLGTLSALHIGINGMGPDTLLSHVVAIADGAMVQEGTDEMGVFSSGCETNNSSGNFIGMTPYQVAQTWASLPAPDNYTPAKAQAAYRTIFDNILSQVAQKTNKWSTSPWGNHIAITQTADASDASDWPAVDANGVPLPPQSPPVAMVPMYGPMLALAATDSMQCYSNSGVLTGGGGGNIPNCAGATQVDQATAAALSVSGWPGLFNDSNTNPGYPPGGAGYSGTPVAGVQLIVNNGASYGGGVKWQFNNDNGGPGASAYIDKNFFPPDQAPVKGSVNATSCIGREATANGYLPPLGTQTCFATMLTLANESSNGVISSLTVLQPTGPGINPPSYYNSGLLTLRWIEAKAIDGLPFDNGKDGPLLGPFYGCYVYVDANNVRHAAGPSC